MNAPWDDVRLAANGKPISENFAAWFSRSKAVDKRNHPLMLFHGTTSAFDSFEMPPRSQSMAAYFTDNPSYADFYTRGPRLDHANGNVIPVYLSIEQPYIVDDEWCPAEWPNDPTERRKLIRRGFDGIFWKDPETNDSMWIAFHPNQIKSAIGNSGLYLRDSASLTDTEPAMQLELAQMARQAACCRPTFGVAP